MRMAIPPARTRRQIVRHLREFYDHGYNRNFNAAVTLLCEFYRLKRPRIIWKQSIDNGATWGAAYEDGVIHLVAPASWKATPDDWVNTALHEMGHYVFWADHERKADLFAERMEA